MKIYRGHFIVKFLYKMTTLFASVKTEKYHFTVYSWKHQPRVWREDVKAQTKPASEMNKAVCVTLGKKRQKPRLQANNLFIIYYILEKNRRVTWFLKTHIKRSEGPLCWVLTVIPYHATKQAQRTTSATLIIMEKVYKGFKNSTGDTK